MTQPTSRDGLVIVDKPGGMTSHDVVARVRRLAGTRKVGHAGTLDPMATGVLVVGVEKATRLLGYLTLTEKEYDATIRLGQTTSTDDAEGEITGTPTAAGVTAEAIDKAVAGLVGEILQVPPAVSAIKVGGQRAYKLTRAGAAPELQARPVTVYEFTVTGIRRGRGPQSGRAARPRRHRPLLERHLHQGPGPRPRRGPGDRRSPDPAAPHQGGRLRGQGRPHAGAARRPLRGAAAGPGSRGGLPAPGPERDEARRLAHGGRLAPSGADAPAEAGAPTAAFAPDGTLIALVAEESGQARPLVVFA